MWGKDFGGTRAVLKRGNDCRDPVLSDALGYADASDNSV
jgi:hypothetical protein